MTEGPWNAFQHAQAEGVQEAEKLPKKCREMVFMKGAIFPCDKAHQPGDSEHQVIYKDDTGLHEVRISWR